MNKISALIFLCCAIAFSCDLERIELGTGDSSTFNITIGGNANDFPNDVLANPDGTFIVAGKTQSFSSDKNNDAYLSRIDKKGVTSWEKNYGTTGEDWALAVTATTDGGFVLAGRTSPAGMNNTDIFLVKVNGNTGAEVWRKTYGATDSTEIAFGIVPTGNGDFLVGYTAANAFGGASAIKFMGINANGAKVSDRLGRSGEIYINKMIKTTDNKIVIVGQESSNSTTSYLAKFNEDGSFIWDQKFSGAVQNYAPGYGVVEMPDRSLFLAGSYLGDSDHDFLLVSYSEIGMKLIDTQWGGANADELLGITRTLDGQVLTLGYSQSFSAKNEIYLSKRKKTDGSEIWVKHFAEQWVQGADVDLCPDGGFIICTAQNGANANIILIKTDANGEFK
ncbi:MAG: hypothetical protein IPL46_14755 [Saprospiraceae bacterium]|nr:hypothetical protein [Saprospiraceae bacterium]